jgi:hypothetical protein
MFLSLFMVLECCYCLLFSFIIQATKDNLKAYPCKHIPYRNVNSDYKGQPLDKLRLAFQALLLFEKVQLLTH